MLVYVAAPNDQIGTGHADTIRASKANAAAELSRHHCAWYDPIRPFGDPLNDCAAVHDINKAALLRADGCLAIWPPESVSVGTPMEILMAHQAGTPVVVVGLHRSLQLNGMGVPVVRSVNEGVRALWKLMASREVRRTPEVSAHLNGRQLVPSSPIKWTGDDEFRPSQGYTGDAGFDLIVAEDVFIPTGEFRDVDHGVCFELPPGVWGLITGRSSTIRKRGILVVNGIIDNGYRGPLFAACQNIGKEAVCIRKGERIAQFIPFPLTAAKLHLEQVAVLGESVRGVRAFGSTGN